MSKDRMHEKILTWVEINTAALEHNIKVYRQLIGRKTILTPSVKANAYGHGLILVSRRALQSGADWLGVNALFEAEILRKAGIKAPIYIMGYVLEKDASDVLRLNCRLVVYNRKTIRALAVAATRLKKKAKVHIKVETGNNRQGIAIGDIVDFCRFVKKLPCIEIEGMATHFANIEDTTNPNYANFQLKNFWEAIARLEKKGIHIPIRHCANSAATLLFPKTHFEMVRPGIAIYGLWPSPAVKSVAQKQHRSINLKPVLTWKTRIAQIKEVSKGAYIGYGCTYRTKRKTRLAILPVGYYDGYDRGFSNKSHVLVHGKKAQVRGRVCMNITMVDVSNIPQARVEDEVTLLGRDGREEISADYLAHLAGTINYEITTRIREGIPRIITTN